MMFASLVEANMYTVATKVQQLQDKSFHLRMEFVVDASMDEIHQILTDYANISQLNPSIVSSKEIQSPYPDMNRVETVTRDCFIIFCKMIRRVEDVSSPSMQRINSKIVPELSDFSFGVASWILMPNESGTCVIYEAILQPKFVTPSLGIAVLQKRMRTRLTQSAVIINGMLSESPLG